MHENSQKGTAKPVARSEARVKRAERSEMPGLELLIGELGYHRIYGEITKLVSEPSLMRTGLEWSSMRRGCPIWTGYPHRSGRIDSSMRRRNTHVHPPSAHPGAKRAAYRIHGLSIGTQELACGCRGVAAPAGSSESSDPRTRGRSSRSSRRPGKPATWRRGAGIS